MASPSMGLFFLLLLLSLTPASAAPVPAPEKVLPQDTLAMVCAPNFTQLKAVYDRSPHALFFKDPAMRPFVDKFMARWREELVKPLEQELGIRFEDYTMLAQGQVTLALLAGGSDAGAGGAVSTVLLVDSRDKATQLKKNLSDIRKKWADAGKTLRVENIRGSDLVALAVSSNDVPQSLKKLFPQHAGPASGTPEAGDQKPPHGQLVLGQVDSLLIVANSVNAAAQIVSRCSDSGVPCLGEQAGYQASHLSLFRDSPLYGWINMKTILELASRKPPGEADDSPPDNPLKGLTPEKVIGATGLSGLRSLAAAFQETPEGSLIQVSMGVPESSRQGIFKVLACEAKEAAPPAFVPAGAVKFLRWRLDGQKAWAALEKMLADISPQWISGVNLIIDTANDAARVKDPGFDLRKNLMGNLGDDIIRYSKLSRDGASGGTETSLFLVGTPRPEEFAAALKGILVFMSQQPTPAEREFLGRKIYSVPLPAMPLPAVGGAPPSGAGQRTLSYAAATGYVAVSTDAALVEEFLRSSESQAKTLRETPGFAEATQKVFGPGSGLLGYENQCEAVRAAFESLRKVTNAPGPSPAASLVPGVLGVAGPEQAVRTWMDFSLLPPFDQVAKYFYFSVYGAAAGTDGLTFKFFAPTPPLLKQSKTPENKPAQ